MQCNVSIYKSFKKPLRRKDEIEFVISIISTQISRDSKNYMHLKLYTLIKITFAFSVKFLYIEINSYS